MLYRPLTVLTLLLVPAIAAAQDEAKGISFRFGIGPGAEPGYFGDDDTDAGVAFKFELERLEFGPFSRDGTRDLGFGFGGSVRFIGERSSDDFEELEGLDDIDPSLEVGGGLEYNAQDYEVFAKLRYGIVGHESFVAELGGDVLYRPSEDWVIKAGPRVLLGDDDYAQTYFSVSDAEGAASSFDAFDARGGIISTGAKAEATYSISDNWEVVGTLEYEMFQEDAADSPLTESDDQISGSLVLTRRITFGF